VIERGEEGGKREGEIWRKREREEGRATDEREIQNESVRASA